MKSLFRFRYFLALSLFLLVVALVPSALAIGKPDDVGGKPSGVGGSLSVTGKPSGLPTQAQAHLTAAKLRACQAKESAITKRSVHLGQLATTMEEKFDAIATRVEEYYTTKVVPSGKTVAKYNSLVSDIQTKKTAVQTAVTKAQAGAAGFSCTGDDPKGQMVTFREDMQAVIKALQDYRTSIKNLIVAVRSVTGETERANPTNSPKPTQSQGQNQ